MRLLRFRSLRCIEWVLSVGIKANVAVMNPSRIRIRL